MRRASSMRVGIQQGQEVSWIHMTGRPAFRPGPGAHCGKPPQPAANMSGALRHAIKWIGLPCSIVLRLSSVRVSAADTTGSVIAGELAASPKSRRRRSTQSHDQQESSSKSQIPACDSGTSKVGQGTQHLQPPPYSDFTIQTTAYNPGTSADCKASTAAKPHDCGLQQHHNRILSIGNNLSASVSSDGDCSKSDSTCQNKSDSTTCRVLASSPSESLNQTKTESEPHVQMEAERPIPSFPEQHSQQTICRASAVEIVEAKALVDSEPTPTDQLPVKRLLSNETYHIPRSDTGGGAAEHINGGSVVPDHDCAIASTIIASGEEGNPSHPVTSATVTTAAAATAAVPCNGPAESNRGCVEDDGFSDDDEFSNMSVVPVLQGQAAETPLQNQAAGLFPSPVGPSTAPASSSSSSTFHYPAVTSLPPSLLNVAGTATDVTTAAAAAVTAAFDVPVVDVSEVAALEPAAAPNESMWRVGGSTHMVGDMSVTSGAVRDPLTAASAEAPNVVSEGNVLETVQVEELGTRKGDKGVGGAEEASSEMVAAVLVANVKVPAAEEGLNPAAAAEVPEAIPADRVSSMRVQEIEDLSIARWAVAVVSGDAVEAASAAVAAAEVEATAVAAEAEAAEAAVKADTAEGAQAAVAEALELAAAAGQSRDGPVLLGPSYHVALKLSRSSEAADAQLGAFSFTGPFASPIGACEATEALAALSDQVHGDSDTQDVATATTASSDDGVDDVTVQSTLELESLDDTAVAISVLAAAATAAAVADDGWKSYAYATRGATRRRRTSTWEFRPPARRPPKVVTFDGCNVEELQALISAVMEPTIIDLKGAVITLELPPQTSPPPQQQQESATTTGSLNGLPAFATTTTTTALVLSSALEVPGWSRMSDAVSERAKMIGDSPWLRNESRLQSSLSPPSHSSSSSSQALMNDNASGVSGSGSGGACAVLLLHRDDVTLANGTLQLHRGCGLVVTGRRVTLRRLEVVDVEAAGWWRQATALPASSLQPSALITVTTTPPTAATATSFISDQQIHGTGSRVGRGGGVSGDGPALELDDCSIVASGRDRDLVRLDGKGVLLTARYSRLRGGANAAVALQQSALNLDCCELQGYTSAGVVALGSSVRLVGSRLLGASGAIVGVQAVAGAHVNALGCFFRGHGSNMECMAGSCVELQGCVLSRSDCRYGLTIHPVAAAGGGGGAASTKLLPPSQQRQQQASLQRRSSSSLSLSSSSTMASTATTSRVRLLDCEVAHAVQVGGGELELERCSFVLRPAPSDLTTTPVNLTSDPVLAAKLAAAVAAINVAVAPSRGSGGSASALACCVAAAALLRVVGCRVVGSGGIGGGVEEGAAVVVEAAREARVHISSSPAVLVRRYDS